jgi:sugar phosphate isomerase/epimerase
MTPLTRRDFVRAALVCSANTAFGAAPHGPRGSFPRTPSGRIAVATYPFRAWIVAPHNRHRDPAKPGMNLAAFAHYAAKEFGVRGIEPQDAHFPSTEHSEILKLRAAFDAAGVRTVNIPVDEQVELCSEDEGKRNAGNASYRRWIDIALVLGSPSIRIWIPKCSAIANLRQAVQALRPTLDYAAKRNIVVNLENDDPDLASAKRTVAAIKIAGTPYLRALPDFGNGLMGGDERFNAQSVKEMFAYAWNVAHVKDAEFINGKHETVSLPELFGIARSAGYRGYYSMESDSEVDPFVDTRRLIEQSLALV